jgi:hypothetical protein
MSKYTVGDKVVVNSDGKLEIGIITNARKKKNIVAGYDVRTERGSALILVPVDKPKSSFFIDSNATSIWVNGGGTNFMHVNPNFGHTRANYNPSIDLLPSDVDNAMGHYERRNDFTYPAIGARSF